MLHTFSVDYRDNDRYFQKSHFQPTSDPAYIRAMERYLGCQHHWTVLDTPALAEALYAAVDARDLPGMVDVDSSLLLFCGEIRKEVTVALSGECADELFGGYPWYRDADVRRVNGFPWAQSTAIGQSSSVRSWRKRSTPRRMSRMPMSAPFVPQKSCRRIRRWNPGCGK